MTDNPFDTGVPHSARVVNHWLGGTDNFAADRAVGDEFAGLHPDITRVARSSRAWRPAPDSPAAELREVDEYGAVARKP